MFEALSKYFKERPVRSLCAEIRRTRDWNDIEACSKVMRLLDRLYYVMVQCDVEPEQIDDYLGLNFRELVVETSTTLLGEVQTKATYSGNGLDHLAEYDRLLAVKMSDSTAAAWAGVMSVNGAEGHYPAKGWAIKAVAARGLLGAFQWAQEHQATGHGVRVKTMSYWISTVDQSPQWLQDEPFALHCLLYRLKTGLDACRAWGIDPSSLVAPTGIALGELVTSAVYHYALAMDKATDKAGASDEERKATRAALLSAFGLDEDAFSAYEAELRKRASFRRSPRFCDGCC